MNGYQKLKAVLSVGTQTVVSRQRGNNKDVEMWIL